MSRHEEQHQHQHQHQSASASDAGEDLPTDVESVTRLVAERIAPTTAQKGDTNKEMKIDATAETDAPLPATNEDDAGITDFPIVSHVARRIIHAVVPADTATTRAVPSAKTSDVNNEPVLSPFVEELIVEDAPPIVVIPIIVPVAIPAEDIEADPSIVDAIKTMQVGRGDKKAIEQKSTPTVEGKQQGEANLPPDVVESQKNPLEHVGESIEQGHTAHTFERLGDSISHGRIAHTAESFGRRVKDASLIVEHELEVVGEKGRRFVDTVKSKIVEPAASRLHLHTKKRHDFSHQPVMIHDEMHPASEQRIEATSTSVVSADIPAWVHEPSEYVPKIEREPSPVVPSNSDDDMQVEPAATLATGSDVASSSNETQPTAIASQQTPLKKLTDDEIEKLTVVTP